MKRIGLFLLAFIILGGSGYFIYERFFNNDLVSKAAIKEDTKTKKKVIDPKEGENIHTDVPIDKMWKYEFNPALDESSLNGDSVYVLNEKKEKVDISYELTNEGKELLINPPAGLYKKGQRYELYMTNTIKYLDGTNVSRSYNMQFITEKEEVEEVVLNPKVIKIKKKHVEIIGLNELKIDKSATSDKLVKSDIIIVPTEEYPEGQALKITKVNPNLGSYTVNVKEPEFVEIYEKLDINKTYPLSKENIILNKNIEGVSLESLASLEPSEMIASSNKKDKAKIEFGQKSPDLNFKIDKGLQLSFKDYPITKKIKLNGKMKLFSPEIDANIDTDFLVIDRFELTTKMKVSNEVTVKTSAGTSNKNKNKTIEIGKIKLPIGSTGLIFEGKLKVRFEYSLNGKLSATVYMDYSEVSGFVYENEEVNPIYEQKNKFDVSLNGEGRIDGKIGPSLNLMLSGYGVIGGGLEGFVAPFAHAEGFANLSTNDGKKACMKSEAKLYREFSVIVNVVNDSVVKWVFDKGKFGSGFDYNNCNYTEGFQPIKEQQLNAGQSIDLAVKVIEKDMVTGKSANKNADMKNVKISTSSSGVVQVKKTSKGINIKAEKNPKQEKVTITLSQTIEGKKHTLNIPITIKNFKQIQEASKWIGEWTRVSQFSPGTLKFSNYNGKTMDMTLDVLDGGNTGGLEGKVTVSGNVANYEDEEFGCKVVFTMNKDSINLVDSQECSYYAGMGAYFYGDYLNSSAVANQPKQNTLSANHPDFFDAKTDADIQKLLGEDYPLLVGNMQLVGEYIVNLEDSVIYEGMVKGLGAFMEGMVQIRIGGLYYIALIDEDQNVRYYTNDKDSKNSLPGSVGDWMLNFPDYPVKYYYKDI